jgi:hypothetical protein
MSDHSPFTAEDIARMHPLEAAAIAVRNAKDSRGLKIFLIPSLDMFTADKVRQKINDIMFTLSDSHQFVRIEGDELYADEIGKETAARHVALLANLLAEIFAETTAVAA